MIDANDDRIALVIETQAKLDGLVQAREGYKQLGTDATQAATQAATGAQRTVDVEVQLAAQINKSLGAFQARGQMIDKTSAAAVAAYRAEGDALAAQLAAMGATEQELDRIGAAIARVEQQSGALGARAGKSFDTVSGKVRTAADGLSMLSLAAVTGTGSLQGMTIAAGAVAQGIAAMTDSARLVAWSSGIGAAVTVVAALAGMIHEAATASHDWLAEDEKTLDRLKRESLSQIQAQVNGDQKVVELTRARVAQLREELANAHAMGAQGGLQAAELEKELAQQQTLLDAKEQELRVGQAELEVRTQQIAKDDQAARLQRAREQARADILQDETALDQARRDDNAHLATVLERQLAAARQQLATAEQQSYAAAAYDIEATHRLDLERQAFQQQQQRLGLAHEQTVALQEDKAQHQAALQLARSLAEAERTITAEIEHRLSLLGNPLKPIPVKEVGDQVARGAEAEVRATVRDLDAAAERLRAEAEKINRDAMSHARALESGDSVEDRVNGRLQAIETRRRMEIAAGRSVVDADRQAENEKRQLYHDTARQAAADAAMLASATEQSHNKALRAVGHFADTYRRLTIGAVGADAAVKALKEGAEAIASLAGGDVRGAALHSASAMQFAATAAKAAQESLGGGGGGASTGGGAGGGAGGGTFRPRDLGAGAGGGQTIIINTVDPTSGAVVAQTRYALQQAEVLNSPMLPLPVGTIGVQRRAA